MAKMKTDSIELVSKLSLQQIAGNLRRAADKLRADVQAIEDKYDALSFDNNNKSDIQVVLSGHVSFVGSFKHFRPGALNNDWAVQVYVDDLGDKRHIELIALGEGVLSHGIYNNGSGVLNMGASKENRDKIATYLV